VPAIACHNEHGDTDLSQAVLNLSKLFRFKNAELTQRLEEDFKTVQKLIAEQRKDECKLQFGKERKFEITKEGVLDAEKFFRSTFNDQVQAKSLIEAGKRHIAAQDYDHLAEVNMRLNDLLPQSEQVSEEKLPFITKITIIGG